MFFHVLIFIFDFNVLLMCFELVFCVNIQVGKLEEWSHGENKGKQGRKNQDTAIFAQQETLLVVRNFRTTHPLCENAFVPIFKKCMLSVPLCEFYRNANLVRTLCEFVFGTNFQNHALCLGTPQECKIFAQHKVSCEICTSSLKVVFSSSNAQFLLHFS